MTNASGRDDDEKGAFIFARSCAICHGHDGRIHKMKLGGKDTDVSIPALTAPRWSWELLEKRIFWIIKFGEKAHPLPTLPFFMPSFKEVLNDQKIRAVLSYLKAVWKLQTKKNRRRG